MKIKVFLSVVLIGALVVVNYFVIKKFEDQRDDFCQEKTKAVIEQDSNLCRGKEDLGTLTRSEDMIHHPTYGDYPKEVVFKQGMDLMPGQSAVVSIAIPIED